MSKPQYPELANPTDLDRVVFEIATFKDEGKLEESGSLRLLIDKRAPLTEDHPYSETGYCLLP
jgi:hypothetical protein